MNESQQQGLDDTSGDQDSAESSARAVYDRIRGMLASPSFRKTAIWTTGSIILALLVAACIMIMTGYNVGLAFLALLHGAVTDFDRVLFFATPLVFTGLSVALAFKCGLFNIGPEGQLWIGAITATVVGYAISLPIFLHQFVALVFGAMAGGLYALLPGLLKAYRGAHEVVVTMMMSYSAILFVQWLVTYPLKDPASTIDRSRWILDTSHLPKLFGSPFLNASLIVALLTVVGVDYLINRTVLGYEMRAVGLNQAAAETAGINPKKNITLSLVLAGALAGLGGAGEILGYHHNLSDDWSFGLGWDGITVAVLGNNNPWGVLAGAIFFGALKTGGTQMQRLAGVPAEMVSVIQGLIVLFVAAPKAIDWLSKQGVNQATWLKEDRVPASLHLITTLIAGASSVISLAVVGLYSSIVEAASLGSGGVIAGLLFLTSVISIFALIEMLMIKPRGRIIVTFVAVEWLLIAMIGLVAASNLVFIQSLILGGLLIVMIILLTRIRPSAVDNPGGEP